LSPDYLQGGYFDNQGHLRVEVVGNWAKQAAKSLIGQNPRQPALKATQLRNFYNKARIIERKLDAGIPYGSLKAEIASFERDAATAVGRGNAPEVFKEIIDKNLSLALADQCSFKHGFLEHFQSILGFHTYVDRSARRQ
jgi:CRISPR/Cas system CSM-associated protein Csm2 small subunit